MKNIICLLLIITTVQANAQKFHYSARAGLNLADKTNTSGSFKTGLNFGASAEYMVMKKLAVELGAYYSMQGSRFKFANTDLVHNYVNFPLLVKVFVFKGLNVFAGPQLGLKANVNKQIFGSKEFEDRRTDGDMVKPTDISAVIGAGYLLDNGFFVSTNVNWGFTTTAKGWFMHEGTYYPVDNELFKNLVMQFNFGYRF